MRGPIHLIKNKKSLYTEEPLISLKGPADLDWGVGVGSFYLGAEWETIWP